MKKTRNILIAAAYVLVVGIMFSGGYMIGNLTMRRNVPQHDKQEEAVQTVSDGEMHVPFYEVAARDGKLIIYKCIGEEKSEMTSESISESVFPKDDMDELKKGVRFDRLESAQQMFENFVS